MFIIYSKTFSILSRAPACGTINKVLMHMAMVWTTLSNCGASHRSLSRYFASLLAAKSWSSCRAQIASLIAQGSSFAYANNSLLICVLAYILGPVALGYFDELESPSPPINADSCLLTQTSMA